MRVAPPDKTLATIESHVELRWKEGINEVMKRPEPCIHLREHKSILLLLEVYVRLAIGKGKKSCS